MGFGAVTSQSLFVVIWWASSTQPSLLSRPVRYRLQLSGGTQSFVFPPRSLTSVTLRDAGHAFHSRMMMAPVGVHWKAPKGGWDAALGQPVSQRKRWVPAPPPGTSKRGRSHREPLPVASTDGSGAAAPPLPAAKRSSTTTSSSSSSRGFSRSGRRSQDGGHRRTTLNKQALWDADTAVGSKGREGHVPRARLSFPCLLFSSLSLSHRASGPSHPRYRQMAQQVQPLYKDRPHNCWYDDMVDPTTAVHMTDWPTPVPATPQLVIRGGELRCACAFLYEMPRHPPPAKAELTGRGCISVKPTVAAAPESTVLPPRSYHELLAHGQHVPDARRHAVIPQHPAASVEAGSGAATAVWMWRDCWVWKLKYHSLCTKLLSWTPCWVLLQPRQTTVGRLAISVASPSPSHHRL